MSQTGRGLFVTGTDTGVGKTVVACALVRGLRAGGLDVGVMKPVETGVGPLGPVDALALAQAAKSSDPLEDVCPQQFVLPAAPAVAASREARQVDLGAILDAYHRISAAHEVVVVEGAGGLLVPLTPELCMADLAVELGLPVLVVARARLGTINHTLLTLEAAMHRHLSVAGVVVSHCDGPLSGADRRNLEALRTELGDRLVGEIPPLEDGVDAAPSQLDVERLRLAI